MIFFIAATGSNLTHCWNYNIFFDTSVNTYFHSLHFLKPLLEHKISVRGLLTKGNIQNCALILSEVVVLSLSISHSKIISSYWIDLNSDEYLRAFLHKMCKSIRGQRLNKHFIKLSCHFILVRNKEEEIRVLSVPQKKNLYDLKIFVEWTLSVVIDYK